MCIAKDSYAFIDRAQCIICINLLSIYWIIKQNHSWLKDLMFKDNFVLFALNTHTFAKSYNDHNVY